ncbi:GNAT family N-acetyltransferase [Candidatus Bathyarchaeota archaeon]|nr:MAG: GNAT family N-acetyltransferase [Candidatus Bathyarchaeota archaeon]
MHIKVMAREYRFQKPVSQSDYDKLYNVMDSVFKGEDVVSIVRRFVENHHEMTSENYFMVMLGEEAVAGLVLIPQKWMIEGVELKVAEMGCVGTKPECRRRGFQLILNEAFDEYAIENGYDLCVLAGIPYFYRQFGYQYAVELDYDTEIDLDKLPEDPRLRARPFEEEDIVGAQKLLEKTQERYLVHSVRTRDIWSMQQETGTYGAEPFKGTTITDNGEIVAYYRSWIDEKEKTLTIRELALKNKSYAAKVAATIRDEAERQGLEKIKTKLSHEDAFSKYLIGQGAKINKPYGWQIKILSPESFLRKIGPLLEKRLTESKFRGLTRMLKMNFWKYELGLWFEDGKLVKVEQTSDAGRILGMNPYASIQLFLGFRSREDLEYAYPDFYVRDGLGELIDVLFPRKPGYIHYCY